jgi:HPt (histidine-containing phosphotransfer) domain-containing protein
VLADEMLADGVLADGVLLPGETVTPPGASSGAARTVGLVRLAPVPAPRASSRKRPGPPAHRAAPVAALRVPFDPDTGYDDTMPAPDYIPAAVVRTARAAPADPLVLPAEPLADITARAIAASGRGRRASSGPDSLPGDQMRVRIMQLLGDGEPEQVELVRDLSTSFHSRSMQLLAELTHALSDADLDAIQVHAQTITESGRMLGARDLVSVGEQIEADAGAEDLEACIMSLPHLMLAVMDARERLDLITERLLLQTEATT